MRTRQFAALDYYPAAEIVVLMIRITSRLFLKDQTHNNGAGTSRQGGPKMSSTTTVVTALAAGMAVGLAGGSWFMGPSEAQAPATSFSAVPNAIGAQDVSGPYDV